MQTKCAVNEKRNSSENDVTEKYREKQIWFCVFSPY